MNDELERMWKDVEGSGRILILGITPEFTWID
jgi:hypothetical protein